MATSACRQQQCRVLAVKSKKVHARMKLALALLSRGERLGEIMKYISRYLIYYKYTEEVH